MSSTMRMRRWKLSVDTWAYAISWLVGMELRLFDVGDLSASKWLTRLTRQVPLGGQGRSQLRDFLGGKWLLQNRQAIVLAQSANDVAPGIVEI